LISHADRPELPRHPFVVTILAILGAARQGTGGPENPAELLRFRWAGIQTRLASHPVTGALGRE
jgi:hypothetical protein